MTDSDGRLKAIPVAEFEGEFVRAFESKLPAIALDMAEGYARGMHVVFEVEARVRNVSYIEDKRGDLIRQHNLALEQVRLADAFDPAHRPFNVGGNSAGDSWVTQLVDYLEGESDELDFDSHPIPDRLRDMLKLYFEASKLEEGGRPNWVHSTEERASRTGEVGF